jgi:transposase-like protein
MIDPIKGLIFLAIAFAASFLLTWFLCRVFAARCPLCGSKWRTELEGDWDGDEQWHCHACDHWWHKGY